MPPAATPRTRFARPGRRASALVACVAVATAAVLGGGSTSALPASFYADADVRPNGGVALVGDSLTFAAWGELPAVFLHKKWGPFQLEARSGRKTTTTLASATSGLEAVRRIRDGGFDPELWIIALGTNDVRPTYGKPGTAAAMVDAMMAEIGPGHDVIWVNVYLRDSPAETDAFNEVLRKAATRHRRLTIADWLSVVLANPQWVTADGVHLDLTGSLARNEFVAGVGLVPGCEGEPPGAPAATPPIIATASAGAPAQRLCHR
ncbi:MAG: GDSL-type esterase/lipase family protein [Ilumatobacteraceae bacterium]